MKKKIPYIITCVQCPAHSYFEGRPQCLHALRKLTKEEEITIPDWCPLEDYDEYHKDYAEGLEKGYKRYEEDNRSS